MVVCEFPVPGGLVDDLWYLVVCFGGGFACVVVLCSAFVLGFALWALVWFCWFAVFLLFLFAVGLFWVLGGICCDLQFVLLVSVSGFRVVFAAYAFEC